MIPIGCAWSRAASGASSTLRAWKKDLWKGPQGENVALAKALTLCPYVSLPMVYGRTGGDFPVALICPQKPRKLERLAIAAHHKAEIKKTYAARQA
mmetsp:Transcript_69675/g.226783  ORF Transcript_69675/g.226783 Transcript_69675/m.226783 type:complete len:96 (-) Transcript_69675:72-359(-)